MPNPIFSNNAFQDGNARAYSGAPAAGAPQFGAPGQAPQFGAPGQTMQYGAPSQQSPYGSPVPNQQDQNMQWAAAQQASQNAAFQANAEGMYASPAAGAYETGRMTVEDTVWKTAGLFGILLVAAIGGWFWALGGTFSLDHAAVQGGTTMVPMMVGALGGFVLSMIIIFTSRNKVRPALIFAYAALEGLFIGGISAFFELLFPGIVLQATLATAAVIAVTLTLFSTGIIRASKRLTKVFMIAMVGYLLYSLLNMVLMWTGVVPQAFGLSSQVKIAGIPLGVIIGIVVVLLAAYSLVLDFDGVQQGVKNGAPREMGWYAGFGIMVTVVWLYLEILRLLAILRNN